MSIQGIYPNGPAQIINAWTIAAPALGAEILQTVPQGKIWLIRSLRFTFAADATVINRYVDIVIDDGANRIWLWSAANIQAAGSVKAYNIAFWGYLPALVGTGDDSIPLPMLILKSGSRIRTQTSNIQAGDRFFISNTNGGISVEEYREP